MSKKEFKVGEVFQYGEVRLKCIEDYLNGIPCDGCYFKGRCEDVRMACAWFDRADNKDVVFIKVED